MHSGSGSRAQRPAAALSLLLVLLVFPAVAGGAKGPVIDEIHFTGNDNTHSDSLLARMETSESGFLRRERLDPFTLGQDLVTLEVYYQELGFLTAEVRTGNIEYKDDSTHVEIHIKIKEGPRWFVENITFQGNSKIPTEQLAKAVGFKVGSPYSPSGVLNGRDNLLDLYVDKSYLDAQIESETVRDDPNYKASVTYTIFEGGVAHIADIRITGLVKTDTSVVRRELTLKNGNRIRVKDVARSQANLYQTGLFRSVYIAPDTTSETDSTKVVTVAIVERRTGQVSFGFGFATEDRLRLTSEARHRNLLGQNLEAGFEGTLSRRRREANVAFTQPWSFGLRFKITEKAGYRYINELETRGFRTDGINFGGSILRPIYPYWRVEGGYDWSRDVILEQTIEDTTNNVIRISRVFTQGTYETRDDLLNTYKGYYANILLETVGTFLGGTASFFRGSADNRYFRKFGDIVVGAHLNLGAMRQQSAEIPIPVTEKFFMGGQGTVRGFKEDRLGPKNEDGDPIGGNERGFVQIEGRIPLFWIIGGVAFFDAGILADRPPGINFSETAAGAGLGLRVRSPIGIARIDAAAPLTKRDSDGLQITFGLGQEF